MANWKKIITSGSNAELNQITASYFKGDGSALTSLPSTDWDGTHVGSGQISGSLVVSGSTFTVDATGVVDIDATGAISLDSSAGSIDMNVVDEQTVSIGLTGASETIWTPSNTPGTEAWSTIVTSGNAETSIAITSTAGGIDLNANAAKDITLDGGQLLLTSAHDTANSIYLHANAGTSETIKIHADQGTAEGSIELTSDAGGIDLNAAAGKDITLDGGQLALTSAHDTANSIYLHANAGTSETIKIHADQGTAATSLNLVSDAGGVTISAGNTTHGVKLGTVSSAPISIGHATSETTVNDNLTVTGNLTINGTTTTIDTAQLTVSESLIFLATGSAAVGGLDAGILVQSGSIPDSGSALYHDINSERWSVAKTVSIVDNAITPLQFVVTGDFSKTTEPGTTSGSYGVGEMWVDASSDIWIRTA